MIKELEALERIKQFNFGHIMDVDLKDFDLIENSLKRLEQIDNANPSEALEEVRQIQFYVGTIIGLEFVKGDSVFAEAKRQDYEIFKTKCNKIEQALKTKHKKELAFDICNKKNVSIFALKTATEIYEYNCYSTKGEKLTLDEFDLLREVFVND